MIKDDKFMWLQPEKLIRSQSNPEYDSVLDFVFVANAPFGWFAHSRIMEREDDIPAENNNQFVDDDKSTDHRPVEAVFTFEPGAKDFGKRKKRVESDTRVDFHSVIAWSHDLRSPNIRLESLFLPGPKSQPCQLDKLIRRSFSLN